MPNMQKRIVILISGRGSNMEAIVRRSVEQQWPAKVVAVISNVPSAGGLKFAADHGISTAVVDHKTFSRREDFDTALAEAIDNFAPDLVALAGFMRVLGERFVQHYANRMVNIHPSLLPAFPGLHTHRRALQAGCRAVGATVHLVTPELDHGPILMQSVVPVWASDDEHSLAARVLATEHVIYPQSLMWWLQGKLQLGTDGLVRHTDGASQVLM